MVFIGRVLPAPERRAGAIAENGAAFFWNADFGVQALDAYYDALAAAERCDARGRDAALERMDALARSLSDTIGFLERSARELGLPRNLRGMSIADRRATYVSAPRNSPTRSYVMLLDDLAMIGEVRATAAAYPMKCGQDRASPGAGVDGPRFRGDVAPYPSTAWVSPWIGGGVRLTGGTAIYGSTGFQPGESSRAGDVFGQVCGGADFRYRLETYSASFGAFGLGVAACSGGRQDLFTIPRHGPGDVSYRLNTNVILDLTAAYQFGLPIGGTPVSLTLGAGPSFRQVDRRLTSDQSFFGGGVPSAGGSAWQTGVVLSFGVMTPVCADCLGGLPLMAGGQARLRFFPNQATALTSPAFGFTERGQYNTSHDVSVLGTLSVPVGLGLGLRY